MSLPVDRAGDESTREWGSDLLVFRLTGAPALGVTAEHLVLTHGVDIDAMNTELQARVNFRGGRDAAVVSPGAAT
jgi:hypothetical protein